MRKIAFTLVLLPLLLVGLLAIPRPAQAQVPAVLQQLAQLLLGTRPELQPQPADERLQIIYGNEVSINQPVNGDVIAAGGRVDINSAINGDLFVAGGLVQINAPIAGSVTGVGGLYNVTSTVGNDLQIAAVAINLSDVISDNSYLASAFIRQASQSQINGSLLVTAYRAWLSGVIEGNLMAKTAVMDLDAAVGGSTTIDTNTLTIQRNALLLESASVSAKEAPVVDPNAQLQGGLDVSIRQPATESAQEASASAVPVKDGTTSWLNRLPLVGTVQAASDNDRASRDQEEILKQQQELQKQVNGFLGGILITIVGASALLWLTPKFQRGMVTSIKQYPGGAVVAGLIWITMGLVASILLMITIIGIPVGIVLMLLWIVNMIIAPWAVSQALGGKIAGQWSGSHPILRNEYMHIVIGAIIVGIAMSLPMIGWIVSIVIWTFGMGAPVYWMFNHSKMQQTLVVVEKVEKGAVAGIETTPVLIAESTKSTTVSSAKADNAAPTTTKQSAKKSKRGRKKTATK